jgi:hypothetical protein
MNDSSRMDVFESTLLGQRLLFKQYADNRKDDRTNQDLVQEILNELFLQRS